MSDHRRDLTPGGEIRGGATAGGGEALGGEPAAVARMRAADRVVADLGVAVAVPAPGRAVAAERARFGRSGIYDVRVSRAGGTLVAEFRGRSRTLRDP